MLFKKIEEMGEARKADLAAINDRIDQTWGMASQRIDMVDQAMEELNSGLSRVKSAAESSSGSYGKGGGTEPSKHFSILECKSV